VPEGRTGRLTIKICTFIDIENMHVMYLEAANRDGGDAEGRKEAIWVPDIVAVARSIEASDGLGRAGSVHLPCRERDRGKGRRRRTGRGTRKGIGYS
jgi:hypothetical protein